MPSITNASSASDCASIAAARVGAWVCGRAAEIAIGDGSEQIDVASIERVSERLRAVAV